MRSRPTCDVRNISALQNVSQQLKAGDAPDHRQFGLISGPVKLTIITRSIRATLTLCLSMYFWTMRFLYTVVFALSAMLTVAQRQVELRSGTLEMPLFNAAASMDSLPAFNGYKYAFVDFGYVLGRTEQDQLQQDEWELLNSVAQVYFVRFAEGRHLRDMRPWPVFLGDFEESLKISPYLIESTDHEK